MQEMFEEESNLLLMNESTVNDLMQQDGYKSLTTSQLMSIWSFSNDWYRKRPSMGICRMSIPFKEGEDVAKFTGVLSMLNDKGDPPIDVKSLGSQNGAVMQFTAPIAKAWQAPIMAFTKLVWSTKVAGISFGKGQNSGLAMTVKSTDEQVVATMWKIVKAAEAAGTDPDVKSRFQSIVAQKLEQNPNLKGQANILAFVDCMKEKYLGPDGGAIQPTQSIDSLIDSQQLRDVLQTSAPSGDAQSQSGTVLQLTGQFEALKRAFIARNGGSAAQLSPEQQQEFDKICVPVGFDSSTPEMKKLVELVTADVQNGVFNDVDEALSTMVDQKFGLAMSNIELQAELASDANAQNAKLRDNGEEAPDDAEVPSLLDMDSIASILSKYGQKIADPSQREARKQEREWSPEQAQATQLPRGEGLAEDPDPKKRRLKLFEDIKKMENPPKVYKYGHWICAVCETRAQDYFWTRTKPKMYLTGPNAGKIVGYANKRTDELQQLVADGTLTEAQMWMYKSIRDYGWTSSRSGAPRLVEMVDGQEVYLQYGIANDGFSLPIRGDEGNTTDTLAGESYWCTAGALDYTMETHSHGWDFNDSTTPKISYWSDYNRADPDDSSIRNPYWVVMDLNNGVLYQHSRFVSRSGTAIDNCLAENDKETDLAGNSTGGNDPSRMATLFLGEQDYKAMMDDLCVDKFKEKLESLKKTTKVTNDGFLVAKTPSELNKFIPFFQDVNGYHKLIIEGDSDWSYALSQQDIRFLTTVRFDGVKDASYMFSESTIASTLQLVGMNSLTDCEGMFYNAKNANIINGIDLSSSKNCKHMFSMVHTVHNSDLYLNGNFSIKQCQNIDSMFSNSPVVNIQLKDTDNVTRASNFFSQCNRLKQFPECIFQRAAGRLYEVFGLQTKDVAANPLLLAFGVTSPFKNDRRKAQEWIKKMVKEYSQPKAFKVVDKNGKKLVAIQTTNASEVAQMLDIVSKDYISGEGKYDGIIFDGPINGEYCFSYDRLNWNSISGSRSDKSVTMPQLLCDVVDFGTLEKGEWMFNGVNIDAVGVFQGTENIKTAACLFGGVKVSELPYMEFPNATNAYGILAGVKTLDKLPRLKFGWRCQTKFTPDMTQDRPFKALFGQYSLGDQTAINNRLGMSRVENVMKSIQKSILDGKTQKLLEVVKPTEDGVVEVGSSNKADVIDLDIFSMHEPSIESIFKTLKFTDAAAEEFFKGMSIAWLPVLDMANCTTCQAMFMDAKFKTNMVLKMTNTQGIKTCANMFRRAFVLSTNYKWVSDLAQMPQCEDYEFFMSGATLKRIDSPVALDIDIQLGQNVKNANSMFAEMPTGVVLHNLACLNNECDCGTMFKDTNINVPNKALKVEVERADNMFAFAQLSQNVESIELPVSKSCVGTFYSAHLKAPSGILKKVDLPIAEDTTKMFGNTNIVYIGKLNAPQSKACSKMFIVCTELRSICIANFGKILDQDFNSSSMFEGCPLTNVYGIHGELLRSVVQAYADLQQAAQAAQEEIIAAPAQEQAQA